MSDTTPDQAPPQWEDAPHHVVHAATTMLGDLMHCVVDLAHALPKPWQQLGEGEQQVWLNSVEAQLTKAVHDCVRIVASRGSTTVPATVESMTFKNGAKVILKLVSLTDGHHQGAHEIADAIGQVVAITLSETAELTNGEGKPKADPDQKPLGIDGDDK